MLTPAYYRVMVYGGGMVRGRAACRETFATEAAILGSMVGLAWTGGVALLLQVWLIPASVAIMWLALAFDLLPHHPHTTRDRYFDTRAYPGRALNVLLLGQNYHLVHHLWTTIPWYRYQRAFRESEPDLIARGAPIGWRSRAEKPLG